MIFIKYASILALLGTPSHATSVKVSAEHEDKGAQKLLRGGPGDIALTSDVEQGVDDKRIDYGNQDVNIYSGLWGEWKPMVKSEDGGMYACGAQIRFEDRQGGGDDTAANGLRLQYCGLHDWRLQNAKSIYDGIWGGWKSMKMCPYGKYIKAARVRFEGNQGNGDDTALNGLEITCVDKDNDPSTRENVMVYSGLWGNWTPWRETPGNKLVKGARVRFEDYQGNGDDTALNGIIFNAEIPNFGLSQSKITGDWVHQGSFPQGNPPQEITEVTTLTTGRTLTSETVHGLETSISAGFSIKGVVDVETSVTGSVSRSTAQEMHRSLETSTEVTTSIGCPDTGSSTGRYHLWQFYMSQPGDKDGPGFNVRTFNTVCTPGFDKPKCSFTACKDAPCQVCE